jgi:threo-3-hydroxy-L-aspartate ammonia-lyase
MGRRVSERPAVQPWEARVIARDAFTGAPTEGGVGSAARRLQGVANRTMVASSRTLDDSVEGAVFLKCENFQRSGSFKFRGAYNAVSCLPADQRESGVLTYSSGNHAQAIALVGRLLGLSVTVVMPTNAPLAKRDAAEGYGAEIILYDPARERREEVAARIQAERGSALIPPFDHPHVVEGQGTATLELLEQVGGLDVLFVPCGGGGLLAGAALAARSVTGCRVVGVEPEVADDATRTFRTGVLQTVANPPTVADGLRTPSLGAVTWPVIRDEVNEMITVSEGEIVEAMRFLWTRMKLVVEPSGAVGLAGLLRSGRMGGARIGVILSGGNVDMDAACALLR